MKKINKELIFLIIGTITLFLGVLCVCALPLYFEKVQTFLALKKISFLQYLLFFNTVCCYFASAKLNYFKTIYEYNSAKANMERAIGQTLKPESTEIIENFQDI